MCHEKGVRFCSRHVPYRAVFLPQTGAEHQVCQHASGPLSVIRPRCTPVRSCRLMAAVKRSTIMSIRAGKLLPVTRYRNCSAIVLQPRVRGMACRVCILPAKVTAGRSSSRTERIIRERKPGRKPIPLPAFMAWAAIIGITTSSPSRRGSVPGVRSAARTLHMSVLSSYDTPAAWLQIRLEMSDIIANLQR